jgi:hypothetical protein
VLHNVVSTDPAPLEHSVRNSPVPAELQAAIGKALAKKVADRFQSAEEMIEALRAARAALGEQDTQATVPLRIGTIKPKGRRRVWLGTAAVGAAVIGGVAAFTMVPSHDTRPPIPVTPAARIDSALGNRATIEYRAVSETAFAPLRRAALDLRTKAREAGVPIARLANGDSLAREAENLSAIGRHSEAVEELAAATQSWESARRSVKPKIVAPVDVGQAVRATVIKLAQAVRSRDVEAVRRVYPNLASDEHDRWVQFFQSTDSIIPALQTDSIEVHGHRATVVIRGAYRVFPLNASQAKRENVEYHATLEQGAAGWRLTMIRRGLFRK